MSENHTEVRMQPRTEGPQRCASFSLETDPPSEPAAHYDHFDNVVHHFDVPAAHSSLIVTAVSVVHLTAVEPAPSSVSPDAWDEIDRRVSAGEFWQEVRESRYIHRSDRLDALAPELGLERRLDPLSLLRELNEALYEGFDYVPASTRVDSTIDEALAARAGVCQDFTHIMIALVRRLGVPARYVSGYLFHRKEDHDRSEDDASHAWMEAYLPGLGWTGFDPTNNLIAGTRHIRVAVGRDYADVPPTRGVYKGAASESMSVGVRVSPADAVPADPGNLLPPVDVERLPPRERAASAEAAQQQ